MRFTLAFVVVAMTCLSAAQSPPWGKPQASIVPDADGYVAIPGAAVPPDKKRTYRAIFDVTRAAKEPGQILPGLNQAGSELNAFAAAGVPAKNVRVVVVFHGPAISGILDDEHYRQKFGVANPNVKVLADLRKAGVEIFVCGQNLVSDQIDPKSLSKDVTVASDALIVLMTYQNDGYALLSF